MDQTDIVAVRQALLACMETGNHGRARTVLQEVQAVNTELGREFQLEVMEAYGIML